LEMLLFLFLYSLNRIKQKKEHLFLSNCQTQVIILLFVSNVNELVGER